MAEASKFASSKVSTKGRKFAARITEVEEQTKTFQDRETGKDNDVTQLMLRFERPDGKYELEWYRIPEGDDPITTRSDLGKLINYFAKAKIPDIGTNDYEPIRELYVWCEVFPRTNRRTQESTDKRFPIAVMTQQEISTEFGSSAPSAAPVVVDYDELFGEVKEDILDAIEGLPTKAIFSKIAAVPAVANHANAEAIFEEAHGDGLVKWFTEKGLIKVENDSVVLLSDNGTPSAETSDEQPVEEATAEASD